MGAAISERGKIGPPADRTTLGTKLDLIPLLALVGVTVVWGGTFVVVKDVTQQASPMDFLAVRFLIATAVLLALRPRWPVNPSRTMWGRGVLLGLMLCGAYIAQTYGQQHTSASISGFITGLAVVFTPVLGGMILRKRIGLACWSSVAVATTGLAVMSLKSFTIGFGESLTLLCAIFLAMHITALGEWSGTGDAYVLTVVQLGVVGSVCLALGAMDGIVLPATWSFWAPVVGLAVLATAAAYLVQTWAQARLPASAVAVVLTLEPVFAGVFGVVVDGDEMTLRIVIGALLVLGAMFLAELRPKSPARSRKTSES
ncbi:Threonine/homoserine efflux transporter RhtA [Lentzea waywayandensis]|uniref:Threonine/homoserine efflux transporter RhtA n=1 Tax=Lentzea waywayandensis TaxID=84724 RepID=A0A1I6FJR3_9PSEU|nr:DMT family transporter [Lentzea waywayandensis]SFR30182.1 Threonine/homoserine efflux transporter RhtA [Lentzea waywayandensis]